MLKVPLFLAALAAASPVKSTDGSLLLTLPVGWTVVPAKLPAQFKLAGPLHYSALLSRLEPTNYLYNRAALMRSLDRLLTGVAREAQVTLELDEKLRHASLANGLEVDYRLGKVPGRPSILLGIARFAGQTLLVQVISHHAETNMRELLGLLEVVARPPPPPAAPADELSWGWLIALWAAALALILAAMAYAWRQLRKPSRFQGKKANIRR
ncbi:MAG: hypothetical protein HY925_07190 [Elusimicrobia bacterium]|nr:hypothetical protein [Elusimicrobiota bacterium]